MCPKDYVPTLLSWVSAENLPEYLGGKSKATLLDDTGPWNDPSLIAEVDAEVKAVCPPRTSSCARKSRRMHGVFCTSTCERQDPITMA